LLLMFSLLRSRRGPKAFVVIWILWVWFHAWESQGSLGSRLESDAKLAVIAWVILAFYACWARPRLRKPR